jgi:uncharacterized protein YwqG
MPKVAREKVIAALRAGAAELGVAPDMLDRLIENLKPAIELRPRTGGDKPLGGTRAGGRPDLPEGVDWPISAGEEAEPEPMPFLLQVNLAEVAPFDADGLLPASGLLSFFFYTVDEDSGEEGRVLYFPEPVPALKSRKLPAAIPEDRRYRSLALQPRLRWTLPDHSEIEMDDFESWWQLVASADKAQGITSYRGDDFQLGGNPHWIQPGTGARPGQELLLQVSPDYDGGRLSTRMAWGDGGNVYFLIGTNDRKAGRFDRVEVALDMG